MSILKIENLTKTYGKAEAKVSALDNVSFSVEKGEFVAIIGQSGAGKSTLFHLIAGLDFADNGKIFLNNVDILSFNKKQGALMRRREVGIIYQFYNLISVLSAEENITLPCYLDKKKVDKSQLDSLLSLLNLEDRRNYLPNQLSGGQQQRVAIGRALLMNPSIILADEPTGNLDAKNSEDILKHFDILNKEFSQTILMITHDEKIAKRASRTIILSDGKIIGDEGNR